MPKKLNPDLKVRNAKKIMAVLKDADHPVSCAELMKITDLPKSQIAAAIKYQRRWFLDHPTRTEYNYIISGKKGYRMPQTDEDYIAFYQTLYSWTKSIRGTIAAVGKYLEDAGHDLEEIKYNAGDGSYLADEMNGEDSWHEEVNEGYIADYDEYIERRGYGD